MRWEIVSLQTIQTDLISFYVNFENLMVGIYVLYVLKMHIKFHSNWMFLTIKSINLFFYA